MACPCCTPTQDFSSRVMFSIELTHREREISLLLIQGMAPAEIARALTIEKRTVYAHLANIADKLNSKTRRAAILMNSLSAITFMACAQI